MEVTNKIQALDALRSVERYIETLGAKDISSEQMYRLNSKLEALYLEVQLINSEL